MKVGILTFPNAISYGATMQMYALYHTVKNLGYDVEIVNYHNAYMKAEKHVSHKHSLKSIIRKLFHFRLYRQFRAFEKKHMTLFPNKAIVDRGRLNDMSQRYSAIICGSDQVWNPHITNFDMSYFLDFCHQNTRRIAYAPSFGVDSLSRDFKEKLCGELKKFYALSIREKTGQQLIENMIDKEVPVVLDPTMLVSANMWEQHEQSFPRNKGDYILYYTVRGSATLFARCREFADKMGLKIVVIGGNIVKKIKNRDPKIEYAIDASPAQWLGLVHHARYVVTNSFHGVAFSIIFRKDFYLEMSSATNSRLSQIVATFGLEDRVVGRDEPIEPSTADYSLTEEKLPELRTMSLEYLKNALGENVDNG